MPIIPLSQIPNAPQTSGGVALSGPVGGPTVDTIQIAQPISSQGMRAETSGISRAASLLGGVARDIMRGANVGARAMHNYRASNVSPAMFGDFSGFTAVGEAVAQAGSVIGEFAIKQMRAKDTVDLARVDSTLRDQFSGFLIEIEENQIPETEWLKTWQDRLPQIKEQVGQLGISGRIAADVEADIIRFGADSQIDVALRATKRSQEIAKGTLFNSVDKAFMQSDYEVAYDLLDRGVATGLMRADEAEAQRIKLEGLKLNEDIAQAVSANPEAVAADMQEALKTGKSKLFDNLKPSEIAKIERTASAAVRNLQVDRLDTIDEQILTGDIRTPDQLNAAIESAGVTVPEAQKRSLASSLAVESINTPEGQAAYKAARSQLLTEVSAYDPAADVNDEKYWALKDRVRTTLLEGDRAEMLSELSTSRKDGRSPNSQLQTSLFDTVDKMRDQGIFGDAGMSKDGKTVKDWEKNIEVEQKSLEAKEWVRNLIQANPQITPEEANKKFREYLGTSTSDAAAKAFAPQQAKPEFFERLFSPGQKSPRSEEMPDATQPIKPAAPTINDIDEAMNGLSSDQAKTSATTTATGLTAAKAIVDMEARRDASGNIKIYKLPSGDGGGAFEFAGINDGYHPEAFRKIKSLVDAGKQKEAENYAASYIESYSAPVARNATNAGVQFALQDTAFNRGPTGATRIMQKALGVKVDGKIGPVTKAALAKAEADPQQFLKDFREAREWYERTYAKRSPGNKFWNGLVNRWDKQLEKAMALA